MEENSSKEKKVPDRDPLGNLLDSFVFLANCGDGTTAIKHWLKCTHKTNTGSVNTDLLFQ